MSFDGEAMQVKMARPLQRDKGAAMVQSGLRLLALLALRLRKIVRGISINSSS
jgi:hypothetical protein